MLVFRIKKNGRDWSVTDPNRHPVRHIEYANGDKGWDYIRKEVSKRTNGAAGFTLTVELHGASK